MRIKAILGMLTVVGMLAGVGGAAGQARNRGQGPAAPSAGTSELTAVEKEYILHMRDEEKLARDVYLTLAAMWDCPVFTRIAASETRHMAAVDLLITKYGLTDLVTADDTVGVFSDSVFAGLYASLIESGAQSLLEALKVGVQIEELDIADLENAMAETDKSDVQWVFDNLKSGSLNHLQAFTRNVENVEAGGTTCLLQGASGNTGKRAQGAGNAAGPGRGRRGRGNGNGNGRRVGNANQSGVCQPNQPQNRDGTCLTGDSVQPQ